MADAYFVSNNNNRKGSPFVTALVGVLIFVASFVIIYNNEGRINLADFASKATQIQIGQSYPDGSLVALTGDVTTNEETGDSLFLKPSKYVSVSRNVLMYSWKEESQSGDNSTGYTYAEDWTDSPDNSSSFHRETGHINPPMPFESEIFTPQDLLLGGMIISSLGLSLPSHDTQIKLSKDNATLVDKYGKPVIAEDGSEIYIENPIKSEDINIDTPITDPAIVPTTDPDTTAANIGDLRVSYSSIPNGSHVTIFGAYSNKDSVTTIIPYTATQALKDSTSFYHMRYGSKDDTTKTLGNEFNFLLWVLRILGFMMMWMGLSMILSPIQRLLGYIPLIGVVGNFILNLLSFVVAVALCLITIFIAIVLHNVVALVIGSIVVIIFAGFIVKKFIVKKDIVKPLQE